MDIVYPKDINYNCFLPLIHFIFPIISKNLQSLEEEMGLTMKHAGVAITVTSLTDTCAFLVGCGTVYPGLQSFSLSWGSVSWPYMYFS